MRSINRIHLVALASLPFAAFAACGDDVEPNSTNSTTSTSTTSSSSSNGGAGAAGGQPVGGGGSGALGGGGSGGTGGVVQPANDACPGEAVAVALNQTQSVTGTITGATDDYTTFCGDDTPAADGLDVVYEVTFAAAGTLELTLDDHVGGGAFDGVVSFRQAACETRTGTDACLNASTENENSKFPVNAGTYWIVVDSNDAGSGDFALSMTLQAALCGDGAVNVGEQCDPGPVPVASCYPPGHPQQCTNKPPPVMEILNCPGADIDISPPAVPGTWTDIGPYNNINSGDEHIGSCLGGATGGIDNVFHFSPQQAGTLAVRVGYNPAAALPDTTWCDFCDPTGSPWLACMDGDGCWVTALYARQGACSGAAATEVACAFDVTFATLWSEISVPVAAFQDTWVFVDSYADGGATFTDGPYYLQARLDP